MSLQTPDAEPVDALPTKTKFFSDLSQSVPLNAWRMHRESGHFDTARMHHYRERQERRYGATKPANPGRQGVLEHVLVVAARVEELAKLLDISVEVRTMLRYAAILHDAGKYEEKLFMDQAKAQGTSEWDAYDQAGGHSLSEMNDRNTGWDTMYIANACGHASIPETRIILEDREFTQSHIPSFEADYRELAISRLALHYVDDITRGSDVVQPASLNPETGMLENELDRRMNKNRAYPGYENLNREGLTREGFGKLTFDVQQEVGHQVGERLFELIETQRLSRALDVILRTDESANYLMQPIHLPEIIDRLVHSRFVENPRA